MAKTKANEEWANLDDNEPAPFNYTPSSIDEPDDSVGSTTRPDGGQGRSSTDDVT